LTKNKKIPCRVCGNLFAPCSYCESHSDIFRWRSFACSRKCATKYLNDTIAYRESLKNKKHENKKVEDQADGIEVLKKETTAQRKYSKKNITENVESKTENNLTE